MKTFFKALSWAFFVGLACTAAGCATTQKAPFAVASARAEATEAGLAVMRAGGNAFDAAIAVTAALAVAEPYGSGIGGGGFYLFYDAQTQKHVMIDAREKAPGAAHKDLYWNEELQRFDGTLSLDGPLAAGIPGIAAAFDHIAKKYGQLSLQASLAPAIKLARDGFVVDDRYLKLVNFRGGVMARFADTREIFLLNGAELSSDSVIEQHDLANTLLLIAEHGRDGFYRGEVAQQMVDGVRRYGGIWTLDDLADYDVVEREPIYLDFYGMKVASAAPPSSGGLVLAQALRILEKLDYKEYESEQQKSHLALEAMRRAYHDRAMYMGDPDFIEIPVVTLRDEAYLDEYANSIQLEKATASDELSAIYVDENAGEDTSHFSIIDAQGNIASVTLSINYPFGSCFVPAGTGVLLNNEMDDFATHPGVPNAYGLVGNDANAIQPHKRPLSSMSPTIVQSEDATVAIGTPGGSRIISMVMLAILDMLETNDPMKWVSKPRYHHQYLPDAVQFEDGYIDEALLQYWQNLGHPLKPIGRRYGNMQVLRKDNKTGRIIGASDPRGHGETKVELH